MKNKRRVKKEKKGLRLIEGGRQRDDRGGKDRGPPPRKGRAVSPEVRKRRWVVAVFLTIAAAGLVTYLLLGPVMRNVESRRNLAQVEAELEEERARTRALEEREQSALSEDYVEEEARGMGYVKPGEIPIIVLDEEEVDKAEEEETDEPAAPQTSAEITP